MKLLQSEDANVQYVAELALAQRGTEAIPGAIELLKKAEQPVRQSAQRVLVQIGEQAVAPLVQLLDDPEASARQQGIWVLSALKAEEAVPKLIILFRDDSDKEVRSSAGHALGSIGAPAKAAVPLMIEALEHKDRYDLLSLLSSLGAFGADAAEAVPAILKLMEGGDERVCEYGQSALEKIRNGAKVPEFKPEEPPVLDHPGEYAPPIVVKSLERAEVQAKPRVFKTEILSGQVGYRHYKYEVKVEEASSPVFLARLYVYQQERLYWQNEHGLAEDTLELQWLHPDTLLLVHWDTVPNGQGVCHAQTHLLLAKKDGQWHDIFRDTQPAYCRHESLIRFRFSFDEQASRLVVEENDMSGPVRGGWDYEEADELCAEQVVYQTRWQFLMKSGTLEYLDGKKSIDLDRHTFNVGEPEKETTITRPYSVEQIATFLSPNDPKGMREKIYKLNPSFQGKETCTGLVLIDDRVKWRGADEKHYYSYESEEPPW